MFYLFPKKIQLQASQAKWSLQSAKTVLLIVGLAHLKSQTDFTDSVLAQHLLQLIKKAKALDIPIVDLDMHQPQHGMLHLGQRLGRDSQLVVAGMVDSQFKQIMQYMSSVTQNICVINDAILLQNLDQHIQWINTIAAQNIQHSNTQNVTRLWALSAPSELILSSKGILLAIAEQLDMDALEIDPEVDLREYGLDSVAIVSLIGLWRANGADITYENFGENNSLVKLFHFLKIS